MITSNYQVDGDIYSYAYKFFCDSRDDKPSNADARDGLMNGAILEETDTGKTYIFDKKANTWTEKAAGGGGGGGGSSTLSGLTDVDITNPSDGQTLVYNATSGKWENASSSGGSGPLIVNVAETEEASTYTYTCDKTVAEIIAAIERGVIFKYSTLNYEVCVGMRQGLDGYIFYRGFTTNSDPQFAANGPNDYPYFVD